MKSNFLSVGAGNITSMATAKSGKATWWESWLVENRVRKYMFFIASVFVVLFSAISVSADDWSTYGGGIRRDGISKEKLSFPIVQSWVHESDHPPSPAWGTPASVNMATGQLLVNSMTYDRAYQPVIADGLLYYASSTDDTVYCLDVSNGKVKWHFVTGGPVRIPPTVSGGRVYAGSDDGRMYCLDASSGELVWKFKAGPDSTVHSRLFIGNGRMISRWPARCGTVVDDGTIYFCAGLFPVQGVYLYALDAANGTEKWSRKLKISAQGHLAAVQDRLFIPTGRNTPVESYSRKDGKRIASYGETKSWGRKITGGCQVLVAGDTVVSGPSEGGQIMAYGMDKPADVMMTVFGVAAAGDAECIYVVEKTRRIESGYMLKVLDRKQQAMDREIDLKTKGLLAGTKTIVAEKKKCQKEEKTLKGKSELTDVQSEELRKLEERIAELDKQEQTRKTEVNRLIASRKNPWRWSVPCRRPYSIVKTENAVILGHKNGITVFNISDEAEKTSFDVNGRVYGLAVSDGSVYASTDKGMIYCFRNSNDELNNLGKKTWTAKTVKPAKKGKTNKMYREAIEAIEADLSLMKGFCLVVDPVDGGLALELAEKTGFRIIVQASSKNQAADLREKYRNIGLYGSRVSVHYLEGEERAFPPLFANLILSEASILKKRAMSDPESLRRLLRPEGGVNMVGKKTVAAPLEGAGDWSCMYADMGGTACSKDTVDSEDMDIQWFGRPGPAEMVDRHYRNVPPLYRKGRLYVPGNEIIYAMDPYNGTILWKRKIPGSRRTGAFLDGGSMAVDDDHLYVVCSNACHALDIDTGKTVKLFYIPSNAEGMEWGWLGYSSDSVLGSASTRGASHSEISQKANKLLWRLNMPVVISRKVFALDKSDGAMTWQYDGGAILNETIVADDHHLYFLEVTGSQVDSQGVGHVSVASLFKEGKENIVALNIETGKVEYKTEIDTNDFTEPVYLQCSNGFLLLSGARPENNALRYTYRVYDARTGAEKWTKSHVAFQKKANDDHGEQNRHPVIMGDTIYAWPYAYNIKSGRKVDGWVMDRRGHGCGGVSGSAGHLFWRGAKPWMVNVAPGSSAKRLTDVTRPGCWINIIPAGGLIMIPEASAGCTCGYSIQTSLTFAPRK